jgi:hypothetical protein
MSGAAFRRESKSQNPFDLRPEKGRKPARAPDEQMVFLYPDPAVTFWL